MIIENPAKASDLPKAGYSVGHRIQLKAAPEVLAQPGFVSLLQGTLTSPEALAGFQ